MKPKKDFGSKGIDMKGINSFIYLLFPMKNPKLRRDLKTSIITNLFPIIYIDSFHKLKLTYSNSLAKKFIFEIIRFNLYDGNYDLNLANI